MLEVKGISFKACDFLGTAPGKVHYSAEMQKGYGIYSLGSSFDLDYLCNAASDPCPDTAHEKCIFENLGYGIYALEWIPSNLISIDRVNFSNNRSSVFISGANALNLKLIPNPARNWVMIDYENDFGNNPVLLEIHGSSGQKLKSLKLFKSKDQVIVNTEQWPAGIYIFRLTTNNFTASKKLIVLK